MKKRPRSTRTASRRRVPKPQPPTTHRGTPLTVDTPLSPREEVFATQVARHHNATRAARESGYLGLHVAKTAFDLARTPHVAAAIARKRAENAASATLDWDVVLHLLYHDATDGEIKIRDRHRASALLGNYLGKDNDPIDTRPPVPAFALPADTPGVSVH